MIKYLMRDKETESQKKEKLSIFLKRKRIESSLRLEDVASGICAVSYLSRIEHNTVSVDDNFYYVLFKKLDIDYYKLKEVKESDIFGRLLKCYLLNDDQGALDIIKTALDTNYYVELEYELMVLYNNIILRNNNEVSESIINLNNKLNVMLKNELTFYLFLICLHAYKQGRGLFAYNQILMLISEIEMLDNIFKYAVIDLALDIFVYIGSSEMFFKYYNELKNEEYLTFFSQSALRHKAQKEFFSYSLKDDETFAELSEIRMNIQDNNAEYIDWLILCNFSRYKSDNYCLEAAQSLNPSARILAFESIYLLCSEEDVKYHSFLERVKNYNFSKDEKSYSDICKLVMLMRSSNDVIEVLNTLKKILDEQINTRYEVFFLKKEIDLFLEYSIIAGRYKDVVTTLFKKEQVSKRNHLI